MASTVTVTGKIGPGNTATATALTGVTFFGIDATNKLLVVRYVDVFGAPRETQFDLVANTTCTLTCSSTTNNYALTIT